MLRHMEACDLQPSLRAEASNVVDEYRPWKSYRDFLLGMAAFTTEFKSEMGKRVGKKSKSVLTVLKAACQYSR